LRKRLRPGKEVTVLLFRWLLLLLLIASGVSFAAYALTNLPYFKRFGILCLKWAVLTGLGFFGILILERIA
jgi:hypothetical protein